MNDITFLFSYWNKEKNTETKFTEDFKNNDFEAVISKNNNLLSLKIIPLKSLK